MEHLCEMGIKEMQWNRLTMVDLRGVIYQGNYPTIRVPLLSLNLTYCFFTSVENVYLEWVFAHSVTRLYDANCIIGDRPYDASKHRGKSNAHVISKPTCTGDC